MKIFRAALAALFTLSSVQGATAQDIILTSHDGKVEVVGTLLGYDGEFYRVDTRFGELTVDGSGVTCDGPACPSLIDFVAEIRFSGSSVMADTLLPALAEGFAAQEGLTLSSPDKIGEQHVYALHHPDRQPPLARLMFQATDTAKGFADLAANTADIVLAQREIRPDELQLTRDAGLGDLTQARRSRVLALDAMVPVVAADNPVRQISLADLAKVFAAQITNWAELGGPDAPITLHLPQAGSGLVQSVEDVLLSPANAQISKEISRHTRSSDLDRAVAGDPFAIGIASHAEARKARALPLTGGCGHALTATRQSVKTEDYPLTSPMFLYLPQRRLPRAARQFLAYIQSNAAQMIIRRAGFVDQSPETIRVGLQGDRLANAISTGGAEVGLEELQRMIETLRPLSRLSLSFRFEAGSSRPDAQSRSNILQLAQVLESGTLDARQLTFIGFSDGEGAATANARIALQRAKTIRNSVLAAIETSIPDSIEIAVDGFGEAMPMACDDTEWGRKVNRRVEVWIR
ncbi:phosphate ABC transporter substrate-binding protein, PhoT family [Ruegeria halocynthiae]|uniref:Phosphate ABC transporter substrate-binding protein, PhoT family n=1 Tax=Ruegeria halocynthiae TaxID=985054 RepID=A0A1H3B897_9RHOB|nr:phosphate ABC transporter substrate-binding/OmpA family protein [Ruegeria halocynthiae]SDX37908.1 phosphate ABC transporter substrate-binding protein, PhoT family [Ruegeria halocynthiae]